MNFPSFATFLTCHVLLQVHMAEPSRPCPQRTPARRRQTTTHLHLPPSTTAQLIPLIHPRNTTTSSTLPHPTPTTTLDDITGNISSLTIGFAFLDTCTLFSVIYTKKTMLISVLLYYQSKIT